VSKEPTRPTNTAAKLLAEIAAHEMLLALLLRRPLLMSPTLADQARKQLDETLGKLRADDLLVDDAALIHDFRAKYSYFPTNTTCPANILRKAISANHYILINSMVLPDRCGCSIIKNP
jgi:hypothetical protein